MENDDAKIIALALGIPSATFVSLALLITISFHYNLINRIGRQRATPTVPTTPTNDVDAILLEQLPSRILAPVLRHSIPIHDLLRNNNQHDEEVMGEPTDPENPEGGSPTPTKRRMPIIISTGTPSYAPYVPRTPSPGMYARFAARFGGFEVGWDIRPVTPTTNYDTWADRHPTPPPAAGIASPDFWDNVNIAYSAYFPSPCTNSPDHRTPPPAGYARAWDQTAPYDQHTLEPVRIEAPIASTSAHVYPAPRSGWQNVRSPVRSPHRPPRASRWQQLTDWILAEQQHEEPEPTGHTLGDWPTESSSDSSMAVNPPQPTTPFPSCTLDHAPRSIPESSQ